MKEKQELLPADIPLMERPTGVLLNDFGAGQASPGSGSAAALLALLAAKMVITVCEISIKKAECEKHHRDFLQIVTIVRDDIEPKLLICIEN